MFPISIRSIINGRTLLFRNMYNLTRTPINLNNQKLFKNYTTPVNNKISDELEEYGKYLLKMIPKFIHKVSVYKDELAVYTSPEGLVPVITFLKDHTNTQYKQVSEITAVDYPERENRFEIVYMLLSHRFNSRIKVKTYANEVSTVPTITHLYDGANWMERETYDMFGVVFSGHPDLRRILTDYGFEGHPLRKDFPLTGYVEVRYDVEQSRIVTEPLEMTQEFRRFDFDSPWEQVPKK